MYLINLINYISGLTNMASSCSKKIGPSYVEAECYNLTDEKKYFAQHHEIKVKDMTKTELNITLKELLINIFGNDIPKLIEGLLHWINIEAGPCLKIETIENMKLIDSLGLSEKGTTPFYILDEIYIIKCKKMVIYLLIGNDE